MTDTLEIFGTEYSGVTGIKATDDNDNVKTYIRPQGTKTIDSSGTTDVTTYENASVPSAEYLTGIDYNYFTDNNIRKWHVRGKTELDTGEGDAEGWLSEGTNYGEYVVYNAIAKNTTVTPTESSQTIGGSNYMMEGAVTVSAMPSGTAGTPTATKGAVNNHSISVTPSVTNTTGYITGSTKTGTAVTVTASELVSGSETKTANGTYDVTNLASLVVNVSDSGMVIATASTTLNAASTSISFTGLSGEPTSFFICSSADLTTGGTKAAAVVFDGTNVIGQTITSQVTYDGTNFSKSYNGGTLTVTGTASFQANTYTLVYTYGGTSANLGTADVQVGSGAPR